MITLLADQIWSLQYQFSANGLPVSTRMTIVRLADGGLWLHSPVPMDDTQRAALDRLGPVRFIVAPSKTHHLFVADCARHYPDAQIFGAPGLREKRRDLHQMQEIPMDTQTAWHGQLDMILFAGIPFANETIWWHQRSRTLIVTDLLQWWAGELAMSARVWAWLTKVRRQLAVPCTVKLLLRDRAAARCSAARMLEWPIERVVVAHNAVVEIDAYDQVRRSFENWLGPINVE